MDASTWASRLRGAGGHAGSASGQAWRCWGQGRAGCGMSLGKPAVRWGGAATAASADVGSSPSRLRQLRERAG